MSRPQYDVRENYVGDGLQTEFTFDFKIVNHNHLLVLLVDADGVLQWSIRADDTTYFTTVTDEKGYNGEITFLVAPPTDYKIIMLLADDSPIQNANFTGDPRFTNAKLEGAFDTLAGQIQRIKYQIERVIILPEDYMENFDMTLPAPVASNLIAINDDGDGLQLIAIASIQSIMQRLDDNEAAIGTLQAQIDNTEAAATAAAASAAAAEADADAAAASAAAAAADAAAAVGASVSNRIQVIPYCPAFMGGVISEEHDVEVVMLDIGNRVMAFTKMSQYFITGRPIKVGFAAYTPTNNLTSKYQLQMTATLVKDGVEVSSVVDQEVIAEETTVSAVASALKVFSFEISPIGTINGVEVDANDGIKLEFKRIDASSNEDVELTRLLKQTFELSFA